MDEAQQRAVVEGAKYLLTVLAGGGGIVWYNAIKGRRDTQIKAEREANQDVFARDKELWGRLEGDNDDLRQRLTAAGAVIDALRKQVSYWEDLARWWSRKAHDLNHALLSARWGARAVLEKRGEVVPESWNDPEKLPALEAPAQVRSPD